MFVTASVIVAVDHYLRGALWPQSVYGISTVSPWRWAEHTIWVVFEDIVLVLGCDQSLRAQHALAFQQAEVEAARTRVEATVAERTAELQRANAALHAEVIERRRAEDRMESANTSLNAEIADRRAPKQKLAEASSAIAHL